MFAEGLGRNHEIRALIFSPFEKNWNVLSFTCRVGIHVIENNLYFPGTEMKMWNFRSVSR